MMPISDCTARTIERHTGQNRDGPHAALNPGHGLVSTLQVVYNDITNK